MKWVRAVLTKAAVGGLKSERSELSAAGLAPAAEGGVSASFVKIDLKRECLKTIKTGKKLS